MLCPKTCGREFTFLQLVAPKGPRKNVIFFGPEVRCRCGERYKVKMGAAGAFNVATGEGGQNRACPKCGTLHPSLFGRADNISGDDAEEVKVPAGARA